MIPAAGPVRPCSSSASCPKALFCRVFGRGILGGRVHAALRVTWYLPISPESLARDRIMCSMNDPSCE